MAGVGQRPLPDVQDAAGGRAQWDFDHERTFLLHVPKTEGIQRSDTRSEHPLLVLQVLKESDIAIL